MMEREKRAFSTYENMYKGGGDGLVHSTRITQKVKG